MEGLNLACHQQAMGLVGLQVLLVFLSILLCLRDARVLRRVETWQSMLLAALLMLLGIFLGTRGTRAMEIVGWLSFTTGAVLLAMPMAKVKSSALQRGLLQSVVLLAIVAVVAPFMNYFSHASGALFLLTLALLGVLIVNLLMPSTVLNGVVSALGAALFSVWTIHDISQRPCASPWNKSVQVFLDLLNLYTFSTAAT
jgi:FtsH-binding integral membrane protein